MKTYKSERYPDDFVWLDKKGKVLYDGCIVVDQDYNEWEIKEYNDILYMVCGRSLYPLEEFDTDERVDYEEHIIIEKLRDYERLFD